MRQSALRLVAIGSGGFMGAVLRFLVDPGTIYYTGVPVAWPTFVVNIGGSFAIGVLFVVLTERAVLPAWLRGPLMIGLVGSFTTFSTVALAGWQMIDEGAWLLAAVNLGGSIVVGMVAVVAGVIVGRSL